MCTGQVCFLNPTGHYSCRVLSLAIWCPHVFRTWTAFPALCVTRFLWDHPRLFATQASPLELTHGSSSLEGPASTRGAPTTKATSVELHLGSDTVPSATFCSLEASHQMQPTLGASASTRKWGHGRLRPPAPPWPQSLPLRVMPLQLRCHVLRPLPDELPTMPRGETPWYCPRTCRG